MLPVVPLILERFTSPGGSECLIAQPRPVEISLVAFPRTEARSAFIVGAIIEVITLHHTDRPTCCGSFDLPGKGRLPGAAGAVDCDDGRSPAIRGDVLQQFESPLGGEVPVNRHD